MFAPEDQEFLNNLIGFFTMIASKEFISAAQDTKHPNHHYACEVRGWMNSMVQPMQAFMKEGAEKFGTTKFTFNPKELLAQAMLKMGGF